jgi:putative ABC transport system ATP-binding protein
MRLSVGQQQRVAAARALIGNPAIIIADEPTSALDHDNIQNFMETLKQKCSEISSTLIFVSHDRTLAEFFEHHITLPSHLQENDL